MAGTTSKHRRQGSRSRRRIWAAAAGVLVVLGLLLLGRGHRRFDGYVALAAGTPERVVHVGQRVDLVFLDRQGAGTRYRLVYRQLEPPREQTFHARTPARNRLSRIRVRAGGAGRFDVRWYVAGRSEAHWTFDVRPRRPTGDRPAA